MKNCLKIITLSILPVLGFSSCLDEKYDELKYTGVWKLDHYYANGNDKTISHISGYRDHAINVEADHSFSERWINDHGLSDIIGTWSLNDRNEITLKDKINGSRIFHLKYTFYLSNRSNGDEWIFKKL